MEPARVQRCHAQFFGKATQVASNACKAATVGCSVFLVLPRWKVSTNIF
ncbi:hypothetical protein ACQJBY_001947 [Aegilops geniculata]